MNDTFPVGALDAPDFRDYIAEQILGKVIAPMFGVWATQAGRDYWKPKETKKKAPKSIKF